jgi:hypothetical protein
MAQGTEREVSSRWLRAAQMASVGSGQDSIGSARVIVAGAAETTCRTCWIALDDGDHDLVSELARLRPLWRGRGYATRFTATAFSDRKAQYLALQISIPSE